MKWEGGEMECDEDAVDDWYDESIIWYYARSRRVARRMTRLVKRKR